MNDRPADVWEPLLTVADAAGQLWPERARAACVELVASTRPESVSLGVRLLIDARDVFDEAACDRLFTMELLARLHALDNAPWAELKGKPLNEYGLGRFLRDYEISSKTIRIGEHRAKGFERGDFTDAWARYCPAPVPASDEFVTSVTPVTAQVSATQLVTDRDAATDRSVTARASVTSIKPMTSNVTAVTDVTDSRQADCRHCGEPILSTADAAPDTRSHTWCSAWTG